MINGTLDLEDHGRTVSLSSILLFAGEKMRAATTTPHERAEAKKLFDEVLALACAAGFRHAPRLRSLITDGFYATPEASRLARLALDHVPPQDARAVFAHAGFIDGG